MNKWNRESPWNPAHPVGITPKEYEKQVVSWLMAAGSNLEQFEVQHLQHLEGQGGDYEFDAIAKLSMLKGASIIILIECKKYSRPVEREKILALWAKLQDVGGHKAMMFATSGFQSGALKFAKTKGIATITFVQGSFLYETRGLDTPSVPLPWADLPAYAGIMLREEEETIHSTVIDHRNIEPLKEWIGDNGTVSNKAI
ncbi:MAG: restriction endonuclease [Thermodesulfobacteriota bacterium]|jgi:restriction system protein